MHAAKAPQTSMPLVGHAKVQKSSFESRVAVSAQVLAFAFAEQSTFDEQYLRAKLSRDDGYKCPAYRARSHLMTARLPERLFKACDPLPPRLNEELSAIASGEYAAIARVLDMTGKLVGMTEARIADQEFITVLLVPDDDPIELDRDAAIEVLTLVIGGDLTASDMARAIDALESTLGRVTDLIFYPPEGRDLSAAEIYATASSLASPAPAVSATSLRVARHALAAMVLAREIELPFGELAARELARRIEHGVSAGALAEWSMSDDNHLGEVFADDAALLVRVQSALLKFGHDSQSRGPLDSGR